MLKETATKVDLDKNSKMHVVDGRVVTLSGKVVSGATIKTLVDTYVRYMFKTNSRVLFDGYGQEL